MEILFTAAARRFGSEQLNMVLCARLFFLFFLATAFYDNAFGFFALKVNKFIELKILQAIKRERGSERASLCT